MARVNVYLPDDLAEQAKGAGLNVSALTQNAIVGALAARSTNVWLESLVTHVESSVTHADVLRALDAERDEAPTRHG